MYGDLALPARLPYRYSSLNHVLWLLCKWKNHCERPASQTLTSSRLEVSYRYSPNQNQFSLLRLRGVFVRSSGCAWTGECAQTGVGHAESFTTALGPTNLINICTCTITLTKPRGTSSGGDRGGSPLTWLDHNTNYGTNHHWNLSTRLDH